MKKIIALCLVFSSLAIWGLQHIGIPVENTDQLVGNVISGLSDEQRLLGVLENIENLQKEIEGISVKTAPTGLGGNSSGGTEAIITGRFVCLNLSTNLQRGSSDTATYGEVSKLQNFLKTVGYFSANVTGFFGSVTEEAVKKFQIENGIITQASTAPIVVGQTTREKIKQITCNNESISAPAETLGTGTGLVTLERGDADSATTDRISFGWVTPFDTVDKLVKVKVPSGQTATYDSVSGLENPFSFKGGSFPGVGGTCGKTLQNDCTLVFSYAPRSKEGDQFGYYTRRHTTITLNYKIGTAPLKTNEILLYGSVTNYGAEMVTPAYSVIFKPSFANVPAERGIEIQVPTAGPYKIISFTHPREPFVLKENTCVDSINQCVVRYTFTAKTPGDYSDKLTVVYNDGFETKTHTVPLNVMAIGTSDFTVTPEKNLLIVYNESSEESKRIKDYYIQNRPGISKANVLGISINDTVEPVSNVDFDTKVADPIHAWIKAHPEKIIKHVVLVRGVPRRVGPGLQMMDTASGGVRLAGYYRFKGICNKNYLPLWSNFVIKQPDPNEKCDRTPVNDTPYSYANPEKSYFFSPKSHPGTLAISTYMDMGSEAATLAYIDKLKTMHGSMQNPSIFISASGTGKQGSTYYIEDTKGISAKSSWGIKIKNLLDPLGAKVEYQPYTGTFFTSAKDVLGFFSWGANAGRGNYYSIGGGTPIAFTGKSNWYLIQTAESFNGQLTKNLWQGKFSHWFSDKAFGGINYSNTPAAAVAHVDEPMLLGINDPILFHCWERGNLFIDCAWMSRSAAQTIMVGDPWIRK